MSIGALLALLPAGRASAQCDAGASTEPIGDIGDAVAAASGHDGFASAFAAAFAEGAHASEAGIGAMKAALSHERGASRAAASTLFGLVKFDGELSSCEVPAARIALASLLGAGALPHSLESALSNPAVPSNATVKHYDLELDLSKKNAKSFPAHARITLDREASATTILEADPDRLDVKKVLADGRAVPFETKDGRLVVKAPGAHVLDVSYDLTPTLVKNGHGLVSDPATGRMWTMTWPYYAGSLVPSNSAPSDGSTATITVKTPAGVEVLASGQRTGDSFTSAAEAPVYANAIYLAPDFVHGDSGSSATGVHVSGVGIGHYASAKKRAIYRAVARDAIDFYSGWLGGYEYGDSMETVELASGGVGGMEHVSAVAIMTASARDPEYSKQTAAHEVAHHWFGDNLRISGWNDFWMSEGFTEYSEYRYFRQADGEVKFRSMLRESRDAVRAQLASGAHALHPGSCTDVNDIFDDIPYEQGAWMLRMLESKMGTPAFDAMLKDWYRTHRLAPVSTEAFVAFASAAAHEDLKPWFDEWSSLAALPRLESAIAIDGTRARVSLESKNASPKSLAVPLRLYGANGETKTVMVKPGEPVTIDAGFEVRNTRWDPDVTVLAEVRTAPQS